MNPLLAWRAVVADEQYAERLKRVDRRARGERRPRVGSAKLVERLERALDPAGVEDVDDVAHGHAAQRQRARVVLDLDRDHVLVAKRRARVWSGGVPRLATLEQAAPT